jgi:hypothetical protein
MWHVLPLTNLNYRPPTLSNKILRHHVPTWQFHMPHFKSQKSKVSNVSEFLLITMAVIRELIYEARMKVKSELFKLRFFWF